MLHCFIILLLQFQCIKTWNVAIYEKSGNIDVRRRKSQKILVNGILRDMLKRIGLGKKGVADINRRLMDWPKLIKTRQICDWWNNDRKLIHISALAKDRKTTTIDMKAFTTNLNHQNTRDRKSDKLYIFLITEKILCN